MGYYEWRPYVSVAERRRQAQSKLAKLKKRGQSIAPVTIEGREIAKSFWGKSWCTNLERYSDYETRLPRGRAYVRNGSVVDLQIAKGQISARVAGSELYSVKVTIAPVAKPRWKAICGDCAGTIDSLVELLQGRLAKGVMDRVCREGDGLFPAPPEIKLSCSCPDWADMCKHVAAALYGVGARLDHAPQLLFTLRGIDENELIAGAGKDLALSKPAPATAKLLDEGDVSALFGLEMVQESSADIPAPVPPQPSPRSKTKEGSKASGRTEMAAAKKKTSLRRKRAKDEPKRASSTAARKKPATAR
ncbi:MAG: SWIM zinc finger family protein [Hyphomicrobiales bacterium]